MGNKNTVVDQKTYLRIMTLLRYYTAPRIRFFEFWIRVLNPFNFPSIPFNEMFDVLELIARGTFTEESTLISRQFAKGFLEMLRSKDCIFTTKGSEEQIDMKKFKIKLKKNDIDIEYLNQLLKKDNEYILENDDEEQVFQNMKN